MKPNCRPNAMRQVARRRHDTGMTNAVVSSVKSAPLNIITLNTPWNELMIWRPACFSTRPAWALMLMLTTLPEPPKKAIARHQNGTGARVKKQAASARAENR